MALTARTWIEGELVNAVKMNTLRDDILELDAVAGFNDGQYGTITITGTNATGDATVSTMSNRAIIENMGFGTSSAVDGVRLTKVNSTTIRATRYATNDVGAGLVVVSYGIHDPRG